MTDSPGKLSTSRLPSLTGMRFIAAFLVFTSHAAALGYFDPETSAWLLRYIFGSGWTGVEFFFILSGFVLMWSQRAGDTKARFWRRRFVKIYPNHVFTWALAIVLALWAGEAITTGRILPSLLLVHTWVPDLQVITSINVPSWTLSCELLFYLSFPWLSALISRIRPERLWWWAGGICAAIMLLPFLAYFFVPGTPLLPGQQMSFLQNWSLVSFPPSRLLDFVLGIVMARIVLTGRWIPLRLPAALSLVVAGFAAELLLVPTVFGLTLPIVAPLALVIAAGAVADVKGHRSVFRGRRMVWLGEVSFAFYLVHFLVQYYAHVALGSTQYWSIPVALAIVAVLFVVTLLIAWAMYAFIEKPSMRRWSRPRQAPEEPALATSSQ
jgi:peptidoglycan/LPS O-acetylase OafA/YrhL